MLALMNPGQPLTMSSREIADLTGKRHDHVLRDIRAMLMSIYGSKEVDQGIPDKDMFEVFCDRMGWGIASPKLGNERIQGVTVLRDQRGFVSEIGLDYSHSMTVVSGYNVQVRHLIVTRWQQLEAAATPAPLNLRQPAQLLAVAAQLAEIVQEQQAQLEEQAPKVAFAEQVASAESDQAIGDAAKALGTGERRLFAFLRAHGILMADNLPSQRHIEAGRFRAVERPYRDAEGVQRIRLQTRITGRGLTYVQQLLARASANQGA